MVLNTRASIVDPYIVVLEVAADAVRALLFDAEARRVEGYSAQLPKRADAEADCLDEMHWLVRAAGFRVGAVVGAARDDSLTAFEGAAWFPALAEGAGVILGSGCAGSERFALTMDAASMLGTVTDRQIPDLSCVEIDEKRWLVSSSVPEAGAILSAVKKGSLERFLEMANADDPLLAPVYSAGRRFREVFEMLVKEVGMPCEVLGCGGALLKSPSLSQRIADALGVPLTLSTEPEPAGRGAALWALEKIGAIESLGALAASTGAVFCPGHVGLATRDAG
jgi:FGGY family of carbohydrate kinases, C-terminal domain